MERETFEIYKPELYSKRLEGKFHQDPSTWAPKIDYKLSLKDIQAQLTPSEEYRFYLRSSGKVDRLLHQMTWKWSKDPEKFNHMARKIQAAYRGLKERKYISSIHDWLTEQRKVRLALAECHRLIEVDDRAAIVDIISTIIQPSYYLLLLKSKSEYYLDRLEDCETSSKQLIELDNRSDEGYLMLASCKARRGEFSLAYDTLKECLVRGIGKHNAAGRKSQQGKAKAKGSGAARKVVQGEGREEVFRLQGLVCMKLSPPKFQESLENFDVLLSVCPGDMYSLMQRACCLVCLRDWERALRDLDLLLHHQPGLTPALRLRARVLSCVRDWEGSERDFRKAISFLTPSLDIPDPSRPLLQPSSPLPPTSSTNNSPSDEPLSDPYKERERQLAREGLNHVTSPFEDLPMTTCAIVTEALKS